MILFTGITQETHRNDPRLLQDRTTPRRTTLSVHNQNENRMHKGFNNLEEEIKQDKKVRKHDILIVVPIVPPDILVIR